MRILFILFIFCLSLGLSAQSKVENGQYYDTSIYIPSFYPGAIDYNLMIAASKGYTLEINRLILQGADIKTESDEGVTPLTFAVINNQTKVAKMLIDYGSDVNKLTTSDESPLLIAVKNQNLEIAEALIRAGADIDFSDRFDATPLHYAAIYGFFQIADLLIYYEASIDKKTNEGTTPLLASIWSRNDEVADLLIQNGANMEARDNDGFTPFLMAALNGDTLLMDLLYKNGVDIYEANKANHNALTLSILTDNENATEFLLKIGKKWTSEDKNVVNPYNVAAKYGRKDVINLLKKNNVPGQLKFEIDQVGFTASSRFFLHDIYSGVNLSFKEPYINAGFILGCDMKLWYTRVLIKDSEHLFHQYMDKGSVAYAGLFKDVSLTDRQYGFNYVLSPSVLAGYTFGNQLKGTRISPENKLLLIPSITLKVSKMNFSANIGLEYQESEFYHTGPIWLRIGLSYNYFFDNIRMKPKTLRWF
jgi:ankyrin repeat protein